MIIVLNAGGQYCHLIARRVRELQVRSEILPYETPASELKKLAPAGLILSGGPASVYEEDNSPQIDPRILDLGIPILGICYGHQMLAKAVGGRVEKAATPEYGKRVFDLKSNALFRGVEGKQQVWMSHGDEVHSLPAGFVRTATSGDAGATGFVAFADDRRKLYGVQFHPEVVHTPAGQRILQNFLEDICKAKKDWKLGDVAEKILEDVRRAVGPKSHALMAVSGGVDSTVAAVLLREALGAERVHLVFVDTGLLRKNEAVEVKAFFEKTHFKHFHFVDASTEFLNQLNGVADPEEKRKRIGYAFIRVFEQKARDLENEFPQIKFLGQGTIYPDRIESASGSKHASKIKSHHNLTLPEDLKLKIVEPLKDLYKDEVRELGRQFNIPETLIGRHPFPGPGLAVRILGEVTPEKLEMVREADAIFIATLRKHGWYDKTWQAFAALLPVQSVGVQGDARTYAHMIALRAVNSVDGMTADWTKLPADLLEDASTQIVNKVKGINRIVYDITQKPPATIEYE